MGAPCFISCLLSCSLLLNLLSSSNSSMPLFTAESPWLGSHEHLWDRKNPGTYLGVMQWAAVAAVAAIQGADVGSRCREQVQGTGGGGGSKSVHVATFGHALPDLVGMCQMVIKDY